MANSQQLLLHHPAHVRVPRRRDHHSRRTGVGLHRTRRVLASWRWPHRLAALYRGRARCPHRAAILIQRNSRLNVIMSPSSTAFTTAFQGHPNSEPLFRRRSSIAPPTRPTHPKSGYPHPAPSTPRPPQRIAFAHFTRFFNRFDFDTSVSTLHLRNSRFLRPQSFSLPPR